MTDAELALWKALRRAQLRGLHFRRQHPMGPYILDFYCPALRLAVEVDGGQHAFGSNAQRDWRRARWLEQKGVHVERFWNNEVLSNLGGVLEVVSQVAAQIEQRGPTPTPTLPLSGGGGRAARPNSEIGEVDR